jgi:hypothetical protein
MTPSAHHQPPQSAYGIRGSHLARGYMPTNTHTGTPFRQPLGNLDQNAYAAAGGGGYSMSGIKVGRRPGGHMSRAGMNSGRPMGGMSFR